MPGRTPSEAVDNFLAPLRRALSRITDQHLSVSRDGYKPSTTGHPHGLLLGKGEPLSLRALDGQRFGLSGSISYNVVETSDPDRGPWKVQIKAYRYHVLTADGTESVLFHWHPDGQSNVDSPHLHVGNAELRPDAVISRKAHIPSGRVALEQVIQLLLREYQVVPRRDDADDLLRECLSRFRRWRTWH